MFTFSDDHPRGSIPQHSPRNDITMAYYSTPDSQSLGGGGGTPGYGLTEVPGWEYTSSSSWRRECRQTVLIVVTFIVEFLLLVSVVVVEYFLKWTDVFPVRRQNFTCSDVSILCTSRDRELMSDFAFSGSVPEEVIYSLSFCVPPFVLVIGELGLYSMSTEKEHRILRVMDKFCSVPHIIRRLLRFLGVFLFGGFALMVFSDVTRNMIGRLRPDFLEVCEVNLTMCSLLSSLDDSACLNTNKMQLRQARTSFPSVHSAVTSYAAVFIAVYIHGALRSHAVRILRGFLILFFLLLSGLCGLGEYCTCLSHWADVAAGWAAGTVMSIYMTVCVLNCFQDEVTVAEIRHMVTAFMDDVYWTYADKSHLTRPPSDPLPSQTLPRVPTMPDPPPPTSPPISVPPAHHSQPSLLPPPSPPPQQQQQPPGLDNSSDSDYGRSPCSRGICLSLWNIIIGVTRPPTSLSPLICDESVRTRRQTDRQRGCAFESVRQSREC